MPFKSKSQRRFLWSQHPEVAKEFAGKARGGSVEPQEVLRENDNHFLARDGAGTFKIAKSGLSEDAVARLRSSLPVEQHAGDPTNPEQSVVGEQSIPPMMEQAPAPLPAEPPPGDVMTGQSVDPNAGAGLSHTPESARSSFPNAYASFQHMYGPLADEKWSAAVMGGEYQEEPAQASPAVGELMQGISDAFVPPGSASLKAINADRVRQGLAPLPESAPEGLTAPEESPDIPPPSAPGAGVSVAQKPAGGPSRGLPVVSPPVLGDWERGQQQIEAAAQARAAAEAKAVQAQADIMQQQLDDQKLHNDSFTKWHSQFSGDLSKMRDDFTAQRINPSQWWDSRTTGQRVMATIGMMLGGAASAVPGGKNYALDMINRQIDQDIDAQKANIGKLQTSISMKIAEGYEAKEAEGIDRAQKQQMAALQLERVAATTKDPLIRAALLATMGGLQQQSADHVAAVAKAKADAALKQAQISHMQAASAAAWAASRGAGQPVQNPVFQRLATRAQASLAGFVKKYGKLYAGVGTAIPSTLKTEAEQARTSLRNDFSMAMMNSGLRAGRGQALNEFDEAFPKFGANIGRSEATVQNSQNTLMRRLGGARVDANMILAMKKKHGAVTATAPAGGGDVVDESAGAEVEGFANGGQVGNPNHDERGRFAAADATWSAKQASETAGKIQTAPAHRTAALAHSNARNKWLKIGEHEAAGYHYIEMTKHEKAARRQPEHWGD